MSYNWQTKLENGEYLSEWRGYTPHYIGCMYGDTCCLGGERKFSHCYDFFSGIGDVEWWIKSEIDKLSDDEKDELESLMERNKIFNRDIKTHEKIKSLAEYFNVETCELYRMGNKEIYKIFKTLNDTFNNILDNTDRDPRTLRNKNHISEEDRTPRALSLPELK